MTLNIILSRVLWVYENADQPPDTCRAGGLHAVHAGVRGQDVRDDQGAGAGIHGYPVSTAAIQHIGTFQPRD